ncbi:uncharacterized protein PV06_11240 [Exophiala oligosperma]|uniref:Uncharacterized protein n=1 Tax=Exophiala oligosperma TaxID=215243 RepID=A0A0D2DLH6_9EURO|nr:uncharacterized protein PV06_11240 [Exophiala oligosperma]KIW36529.1 hypothetical protein PV06_11240 [Exophiala oligosperma]
MGEEPSRLLHEELQSRTLNVLFTDEQFVQQFQKALDRDPLTEAALRGIKPFVIPSNRTSRRAAAEKLPVDTKLSDSVQELCDRLKENPSCLTVREDLQTRQNAVKVDDPLSVHGLHTDVEDSAQLYEVTDSLLCILMNWYTSKSSPEEFAQQIFESKCAHIQDKLEAEEEKRSIIANCRRRSLSGSKIYTFCSDFIEDPGAVFHLPREVKAMIVAIGLPNKSFRDIHDILSRRLIEKGIKIHAKENRGAEILQRMKSVVDEATLRWHTPVVAGGAPRNTSAVAPAAIPSQQRDAINDNENLEAVTPVNQTTVVGASRLARDEHISWDSGVGVGGDPCHASPVPGESPSTLSAHAVSGSVLEEPESDNIGRTKRRRLDQPNMEPLDRLGPEDDRIDQTLSVDGTILPEEGQTSNATVMAYDDLDWSFWINMAEDVDFNYNLFHPSQSEFLPADEPTTNF